MRSIGELYIKERLRQGRDVNHHMVRSIASKGNNSSKVTAINKQALLLLSRKPLQ